jgi:PAS domain S-box-containing protein
VLLLVSAMGYRIVRYSNDANQSVARTYQVLNALDNVLTNLVDAETGTRGYGVTGMSRYLEPFERAKSELAANIDAVAALTVDNPAQQRRAAELRAQSTATMALLQQIVSLARRDQPIPLDLRDPAKANMDVVRATLQQMRLEELRLMEQRNLSARNAAIATQAVMLGLTAVAFGVMLVSFLLVDRRAVQLRQANEMLGARVLERTALLETTLASERAARRQAENAQARFQQLVESAPTAMIAVDKQGAIVLVNALTERLFGYRRDELVGKSVEMLVPDRFRLNHPRYRAEFSDAPQSRPMGAGRDLYGVRRDRSEVPIEIGLNPIDVDGETVVLSSIVDITDRKRADQERARLLIAAQQARAEAEEANRSKDLFLARVSHELRTPLNALMGWTRMLRDGQLVPARVPTVIGSVDRNCEVLKTLVDDLVEMSRISTGKLQLNRSHIDVVTVVRESISLLEDAAKAKDIKVEMDIDSEPMVVDGDPTRLRQVFWNLLSNAIRFTPPEGRVELSVRLTDGETEIRVVDSGQGIASEFLPHVFEPFSQSESGGQGLGLGLSIVHHLVKAHDGRISVTSPGVGAGATFTVNLPVLFVPESAN